MQSFMYHGTEALDTIEIYTECTQPTALPN